MTGQYEWATSASPSIEAEHAVRTHRRPELRVELVACNLGPLDMMDRWAVVRRLVFRLLPSSKVLRRIHLRTLAPGDFAQAVELGERGRPLQDGMAAHGDGWAPRPSASEPGGPSTKHPFSFALARAPKTCQVLKIGRRTALQPLARSFAAPPAGAVSPRRPARPRTHPLYRAQAGRRGAACRRCGSSCRLFVFGRAVPLHALLSRHQAGCTPPTRARARTRRQKTPHHPTPEPARHAGALRRAGEGGTRYVPPRVAQTRANGAPQFERPPPLP